LAKLALLGLRQLHGQTADALACAAHLQPRAKIGGGSGACFAWLALRSGRWCIGLHCALLALSEDGGEGSVVLGLLGLVRSACVGVKPLTSQLTLLAPSLG
jgi:hypothetical protein